MHFKYIYKLIFVLISIFTLLSSCGLYKPVDARKVPQNAKEKRIQNIKEGKGVSLKNVVGNRSTTFEFSTSNPLWQASLEVLDFIPLTTVDYAGGMIITDWYNSGDSDEYIKISIRFLTNEISSNSLKIIVYKKNCVNINSCKTSILDSKIKTELNSNIIKKAALIERNNKKNN